MLTEQNPVELLWREVRRKYFHNAIFASLNEVEIKLQEALLNYYNHKQDIKKLSKGFLSNQYY